MLRPIKNSYHQLDYDKLTQILRNPRDFAMNPYYVFLLFVLNSIKEGLLEPDEDEEYTIQNLWFLEVNKKDLERLVQDCIDDFCAAMDNFIPIKFAGSRWTIHKQNTIDRKRLHEYFQFPEKGDCYVLDPKGIVDLQHPRMLGFEQQAEVNRLDIEYLKKVQELGNTDEGWEQLTDMEAAAFCWMQFADKHPDQRFRENDLKVWYDKYCDYHGVPLQEIRKCFRDIVIATHNGVPQIPYCFSKEKIQKWNSAAKQKSVID